MTRAQRQEIDRLIHLVGQASDRTQDAMRDETRLRTNLKDFLDSLVDPKAEASRDPHEFLKDSVLYENTPDMPKPRTPPTTAPQARCAF